MVAVTADKSGASVSPRRRASLRYFPFILALAAACVVAVGANASQLIDRNAHGVQARRQREGRGDAHLYVGREAQARPRLGRRERDRADTQRGRRSRSSSTTREAGASTHTDDWKTFGSKCGAYDGPPLAWKVAACTAPDGSYWALQAWQRMLPNYGVDPSADQAVWELRLSHWTGDLPVLTIGTDWAWHQWDHLYGTFTYARQPGLRLQVDRGRQPARHLRPQHLCRHVRLGVRRRLEAREQLPRSQRHRRLLLQLQPARRRTRPARATSTAPRSRAPASRRT